MVWQMVVLGGITSIFSEPTPSTLRVLDYDTRTCCGVTCFHLSRAEDLNLSYKRKFSLKTARANFISWRKIAATFGTKTVRKFYAYSVCLYYCAIQVKNE